MTPRAALTYVHPGDVRASFMYSVVRALAHEAGTHGAPFLLIAEECPSGDLPAARNRLVAHFLDNTTPRTSGWSMLTWGSPRRRSLT